MILIMLILSVALILGGSIFIKARPYSNSEVPDWLIVLGVAGILITIIIGCLLGKPLINARDVDERIAMYEEQNTEIESQVETAVKLYMSHEDEVFESASPEDYITLVSLYPDLKSDTLMQKQIELYIENNKKICELKEEKITAQRSKFWLYFGR